MKIFSPANITAFLVFSASAILNYFGSSPKILYLPAFALCLWIMYQTHAYVSYKEAAKTSEQQTISAEKPKDMSNDRPNINIASHGQSGGFTGIGTLNIGPTRRQIPSDLEDEIVNSLANAPKGRVRIAVTESDQEAMAFARQIESVLTKSGYQVNFDQMMMMSGPRGAPVGLGVTVKDATAVPPHAQAVGDVLAKAGLNPQPSSNSDRDADVLYITVGAKPLEP